MSRNPLLEAGAKSGIKVTATATRAQNHLVRKPTLNYLAKLTLSKEFRDIQVTTECGFTLKRVRDMIKAYSQMHRMDKYSQHSSII